jgi:cellulose synthase/poly-beta-1,6-N-acetylglucosamine synthase-like glycosyltransferase
LLLLILAALTLLVYLTVGLEVSIGSRRVAHLDHISPIDDPKAPPVTVIVPACNEERGIEPALASVLSQDYPDFEVIAVDDRSSDSTGAILDRMASLEHRLRVLHIRTLPDGWLGKNWANYTAASQAAGALLLFTDADVVMEPSVLRRAARYMCEYHLDHLAVPPRATVRGFLPNAFLGLFALLFGLYTRPWKVRDPRAREHIGIGAFNMLRAAAYREVGGHAPIAMRPDDDMKLGKLLKTRGYAQDVVFGARLLAVEWYASFDEMRRGLMKNLFAGLDYRITAVVAAALAQLVFFVWPCVACFVTGGVVRSFNAAAMVLLCVSFTLNSRLVGIRWWWCFTIPVAALVSVYLMVRSMILTLRNGGIEWRGTHYPLSRLRANRL